MAEKILVIDDHAITNNLVSVILKQQGYRLYMANSGEEGLRLADQEDPDLILLDVMMPDMDGLEVCRRLRSQEKFLDTPIIMFTAKSMADEKWEGFQAGATDYLVKPTNTDELTKRVRSVLNRSSKPLQRQPPDTASLVANGATTPAEGRQPELRPQTMAFVGARGGSGTTTAAINTALIFANLSPTLLVDLDMVQGHIAQYLNMATAGGLNTLIAGGIASMRGQLANEVVPYEGHLQLLLARPNIDGNLAPAEPGHITHLTDALSRSGRQVVVDAGTGITPLNRPLLERVDHIVVCARPERVSLTAARQLLASLEELILPTAQIHVLLLSFAAGGQVPRQSIESFLGRATLSLIELTPAQMARAVNQGLPLVKAHADTPLPRSFALVAKTLAAT